MIKQESINIKDITDYRCKECKKDWTKCSKCPVMMEWVMEHKASPAGVEGSDKECK